MPANLKDTNVWHYIEDRELWLTCIGRVNFLAISKKFASEDDKKKGEEGKYSIEILIQPDKDLKPIKRAVLDLAKEEWSKCKNIFKPTEADGKKHPFLKADEKNVKILDDDGEEVSLAGWTMIRANTFRDRPVVRDAKGRIVDVDDLDEKLYSGAWVRLSVKLGTYNADTNKGVKFYLEAIQLLKDDKKTGRGGGSDGSEFAAVDDENEFDGEEEFDPLA